MLRKPLFLLCNSHINQSTKRSRSKKRKKESLEAKAREVGFSRNQSLWGDDPSSSRIKFGTVIR